VEEHDRRRSKTLASAFLEPAFKYENARMKRALITGIAGQDGTYLAEFLVKNGYEVHGIHRRPTSFNGARVNCPDEDSPDPAHQLFLHHGDMTDANSLVRVIQEAQPQEIYNLAALSRVAASFESPECTADVNALGTLRLLEAIRILGLTNAVRFYQASSSELYGLAYETPQSESTPFHPRSPYSVAKLYAYWITVNYREAYGMYACNGILFNHESPLRGETFVTRKITRGFARIKMGLEDCLLLGNMDVKRDWGHARDYVEMMWMMLQQDSPEDFVIATGQQYSVREFVNVAAEEMGLNLTWRGRGLEEQAFDAHGRCVVAVDPRYFRPSEVETVVGDASKARTKLGWRPKIPFREIVAEMAKSDLQAAERERAVMNTTIHVQE
jgi:GDPmannose 4,6-dehydratase